MNGHGGNRARAGRKRKPAGTHVVTKTITLLPSQAAWLEAKIAEFDCRGTSDFFRRLLIAAGAPKE